MPAPGADPHAARHSTLREGLVTGLLGAAFLAAWYVAADALNARVLHTPSVLGQLFLAGDGTPVAGRVVPAAVGGYAVLHLGFFLAAGVLLAWLTHLSLRRPALRFGVIIGLVLGVMFLQLLLFLAPPFARDPALRWSAMLGLVPTVLVMGYYLWRSHAELGRSVERLPLGAEVKGPPHAPGGPRV
jgi:hypothetical protein